MQNGTTTLKNGLAVCYKVKDTFTVWPSNSTLGNLPRNTNLFPHANLYAHNHSIFIGSSRKVEIIHVSINRWVVYPPNGIILSNRKQWITHTHRILDDSSKHYHTKYNKSDWKHDLLYDSNLWNSRKRKTILIENLSVVAWSQGSGWLEREKELWDDRSALYCDCDIFTQP